MRLKLTIAYDGAPFQGWQSQTAGNTVQDFLERAAKKISGQRMVVHGSGRTDTGVHALGQVAHLDVPAEGPGPEGWLKALNANLPLAIRVLRVRPVGEDFHARFSARGKCYRYLFRNAPILPPHEVGRVWLVPRPLDPAILEEAATIFLGTHDFAAFAANRRAVEPDTTRTITKLEAARDGTLWRLTVEGEGFLYKMVRMITGAMIRVAQGRESPQGLRDRLKHLEPKWTYVAPADGLYLVKVFY